MEDKYIIHFISKTKANMVKFIENKLSQNGLDELIPTHGNILTALYENNGILTMKEIATKIGKDKSTVTVLVNKLINLGYIERQKCANDKRITYIKLTKKALLIEDTFDCISTQVKDTAYHNITENEKQEFLRILKKINDNFKNAD
ncbi:MarR family transcriptional regulator [Clostridioides difficile]|uniref:MarR family winged helix-turn-helix transcriptional regulator n=1 Tax=unclassified Clostridioides TaxID=2635829 RepID=UPI0006BC0143|nr:MarR family transcriptional regulator [Clostridioides difficile]KPI48840.1 MarR family transcriptional regulator [Clostridioides difficile]MDB3086207.1 MarR family transcriptional regulator [Clostridioides difficile]MDI0266034.1 MarR family transcriptional regulator [Clostridioides difficile]MDI7817088.1 MarR family transcriptional regulator [Clostridioides difficile]